jgi:ubiquinone/menaquinone biosynthesis C-methylase UbiE
LSDFSRELIARSGYAEPGFAALYDRMRPAPPDTLLEILSFAAQVERPRLVVDLGAGTGLSTRAWADRADEVVGVEANPAMAQQATAATDAPNVRFVVATADATGLPDACADLVTCAQSFHWMEPQPVLAEAARLLRRGGVFAAYDYDWPPTIEPELDAAFDAHQAARTEARERLELRAGAASWPKTKHVAQIRASGRFRFAREIVCHGWDSADAERAIGLTESIGGPHAIFGGDAPAVQRTFEELRAVAYRILGDRRVPMLLGYRIRLGVR